MSRVFEHYINEHHDGNVHEFDNDKLHDALLKESYHYELLYDGVSDCCGKGVNKDLLICIECGEVCDLILENK